MNSKNIFVFTFSLLISVLFIVTSCAGSTESLYIEKCSDCHGENGTGKKANVDFTRQKFSVEKIKNSIESRKTGEKSILRFLAIARNDILIMFMIIL